MKNFILKTCAMGMALTLLAGCGDNSNNTANTSDLPEDVSAAVSQEPQQNEVSDVLLWINGTYAVLTDLNGEDYTLLGGLEPNAANKAMEINALEGSWGVTDRASADETLAWLLEEGGHREGYAEIMEMLDADGVSDMTENELVDYLTSVYQIEDPDEALYLAKAYPYYLEHGAGAIDAWDYCRAVSLAGWYYIAGYYTEEESIEKSLEIAKIIQERFSSWDEMMDSYLMGYEYWGSTSSSERRAIYEDIKARDNSPYSLDWNLPLEWNE
ncbi:MAG: DUF1266 domain-containing protein [Oscillospiraceae bacterium]|nr:DUF1266 domain-containing protein [Oscillospiraceae bacterium]